MKKIAAINKLELTTCI